MASESSKDEKSTFERVESNESVNNDESSSEDHLQRKRSRVRSHPDEETNDQNSTEKKTENNDEKNVKENDNNDQLESKSAAPMKRRRLNPDHHEVVDQDETTNETIQTTTTDSESKDLSSTTTDDDDDDDDDDEEADEDDDNEEIDDGEEKSSSCKRNLYWTLRQRELGLFCRGRDRNTCRAFHNNTIGNRSIVQRMKVSHTLDGHEGCVNALAFNRTGTLLASGSDDLQVILWEWASNQVAVQYESGHRSNVFQAKFVPFSDDCKIISCARDGQVRLAELRPDGTLSRTKKLAQHIMSAHKLSVDTIAGRDVFSCGEDGLVYHIDLRDNKANQLLTVMSETRRKLPLYSIELNRFNQNEFVVSGLDPYIRVFDQRFIDSQTSKPLKNFCPDALKKIEDAQRQPSVTCAVYNYNGTEILGSYNDEDIYLFDATHSDGADAIRHYQGHRNSNTVKGVNFYGRNSEYVISGSDCGHVFIWDKISEKCLWFDKGDDDGTVNVLEPHPHFPIIATSGLEHDIKIWQPLNDKAVDFKRLKLLMKRNAREREHELQFASVLDHDTGDLLRLMRPVFRRIIRRSNPDAEPNDDDDDNDDDDEDENEDEDEDEENPNRRSRQVYSFDCAPS